MLELPEAKAAAANEREKQTRNLVSVFSSPGGKSDSRLFLWNY